jgi:hypothetical protein
MVEPSVWPGTLTNAGGECHVPSVAQRFELEVEIIASVEP